MERKNTNKTFGRRDEKTSRKRKSESFSKPTNSRKKQSESSDLWDDDFAGTTAKKPSRSTKPTAIKDSRRSTTTSHNERPKRKSYNDSDEHKSKYQEDKKSYKSSHIKQDADERPKRKTFKDSEDFKPKRRSNNEDYKSSYTKRDSEERPRRRTFKDSEDYKPKRRSNDEDYKSSYTKRDSEERPRRRTFKDSEDFKPKRRSNDEDYKSSYTKRDSEERPINNSDESKPKRRSNDEDYKSSYTKRDSEERPRRRISNNSDEFKPKRRNDDGTYKTSRPKKHADSSKEFDFDIQTKPQRKSKNSEGIRLNKYISNSGICSRREADKLIEAGAVSVNGQIITELGTRIKETDVVSYGGETLVNEKKKYLLLNKPKGFITTLDDPQDRNTVMMLIRDACRERIYPVGRLDRNTTGLLLFTNDGEMAKKLTHPSHGARKIYHVELNKNLTKSDITRLLEGIQLEDGNVVAVDDIAYPDESNKKEVGVEIHSGQNRIVRRLFESLGYEVKKLDRTMFAGLTKKELPRGHWRFLNEKEINFLKMI